MNREFDALVVTQSPEWQLKYIFLKRACEDKFSSFSSADMVDAWAVIKYAFKLFKKYFLHHHQAPEM